MGQEYTGQGFKGNRWKGAKGEVPKGEKEEKEIKNENEKKEIGKCEEGAKGKREIGERGPSGSVDCFLTYLPPALLHFLLCSTLLAANSVTSDCKVFQANECS